ncbi:MAG: sulfatase [Candidatus Cyclobacteriaceae bacterium M3_2C_046]
MRVLKILTIFFFFHLSLISKGQDKPNIIFILADDMGYKDLGCYDNPFNETPVLDQLAEEGMMFTQAYAHPACSPSRAALMTGKHPARLHITTALGVKRKDQGSPVLPASMTEALPSNEITLAEILKSNGYQTGIVGKWHLGGDAATSAHGQGFDYDRVISENGLDYYNYAISSRGKPVFEDTGAVYLTDKLSDYGVQFIRQQQKDQPFFLYMAYSAPHLLIIPKAEKVSKYMWKYNEFEGKYNPYYATMIESMDEGIGRLLGELQRKGMADNTLIVFKSDNGGVGMDQIAYRPTSMDPLRAWKGHVFEGGIRVPLIMHWPGHIQPGAVNQNYVVIHDFLPTIMDLIGDQELPENLDGQSFLPIIQDSGLPFDRGAIYFHFPHFSGQGGRPAGAVRLNEWKLVENYETGQTALFNLEEDIGEEVDLSLKNPAKSAEMYKLLKDWQKKIKANMPEKNPEYNN